MAANAAVAALRTVLHRELGAVAREVEAYPDDDALWATTPGIVNSGGALAAHLAGNIQHFLGAVLGGTGYRRDRDFEFSGRAERSALLAEIEAARRAVDAGLATLTAARLEAEFPAPIGGRAVRTVDFLAHLVAHMAYHLGQIDYHRRITAAQPATVDAVAVSALPPHPGVGASGGGAS